MSTEALRKSESYFDHAVQVEEIRFPSSGDVDRSFSLLVLKGPVGEGPRILAKGIAIFDNDNLCILVDGIDGERADNPFLTMMRIAEFQTMEWQEFSETCRKHPRYRSGISDVDLWVKSPHPGNLQNQASIGAVIDPSSDMRTEFLMALDEDPEVPYSFPAIDRTGIEEELCRHFRFEERNGRRTHIAWDIRMNMNWNRTGRIRNGVMLDPESDHDWTQLILEDASIVRNACSRAVAPYTDVPTTFLDMEEYPCEFRRIGTHKGYLIIENFAGHFLFSTPDITIRERLIRLNDDEILALWAIIRVMDEETSRAMRISEMEYQMHELRVEFERNVTSSMAS